MGMRKITDKNLKLLTTSFVITAFLIDKTGYFDQICHDIEVNAYHLLKFTIHQHHGTSNNQVERIQILQLLSCSSN